MGDSDNCDVVAVGGATLTKLEECRVARASRAKPYYQQTLIKALQDSLGSRSYTTQTELTIVTNGPGWQEVRHLVYGAHRYARTRTPACSHTPTRPDAHTPTRSQLTEVSKEAMELPSHISDIVIDSELKSLQDELDPSHQLLPHALSLARFGSLVQDCDHALSDLLEHIDSYPAPPSGPLEASYVSSSMLPPEEQLHHGRLAFTKDLHLTICMAQFLLAVPEARLFM